MRRKDEGPAPGAMMRAQGQEKPVDITEFCDVDSGRMIVKRGVLIHPSALKLNEAMSLAAGWWQSTGRHAMPDARKANEYLNQYGIASGLLLGYDWDKLTKEEKLKILRAWWLNIGVVTFADAPLDINGDKKGVIH